jgi:hypothetical protein
LILEGDGCRLASRRDRGGVCYTDPPKKFFTPGGCPGLTRGLTLKFDTFSPVKDLFVPFYAPE